MYLQEGTKHYRRLEEDEIHAKLESFNFYLALCEVNVIVRVRVIVYMHEDVI